MGHHSFVQITDYGATFISNDNLQQLDDRLCWTKTDIEKARKTLETQVLGVSSVEVKHRSICGYSPMETLIPALLLALGSAMLILSVLSTYYSGIHKETVVHTKNMDVDIDIIDLLSNLTMNSTQVLPP